MQDRGAHLFDQLRLAVAAEIDLFLKDVDHIRHRPGVLDAAPGTRPAAIKPQEQAVIVQIQIPKQTPRWAVADFNRHFLEKLGELRRQVTQRRFHQRRELGLAHVICHGTVSFAKWSSLGFPILMCPVASIGIAMRYVFARPGKAIASVLSLLSIALLCGCGAPSFLVTPVSSSHTLREEVVEQGSGFGSGKIVIIPVEGMLADARSGGFLQASENPLSLFVQELEKAEGDDSVKAIVLRVNSPGGPVTSADTMYQLLK